MNKIININLGGVAFVLDDNAFSTLAQYIEALRQHFANSEGCDEIVADIEARIAELLTEYLKDRSIVTLADVKRAISVMGIPTEIEGNASGAADGEPLTQKTTSDKKGSWKTGKRLFRNIDERVISGVCGGLAAYFGIADAIWIRLAFIASLFLGGFGIAVYFILAIVMPKATTAADRLSMRGEDINANNIAKTIEQEMGAVGTRLNSFGQEVFGKKGTGSNSSLSGAADTLGNFAKAVIKIAIFCLGGFAILTLLVCLISFFAAGIVAQPYVTYFTDSTAAVLVGWIALLLLATIPLILLILGILKLINSRFNVNQMSFWGLGLAWIGALLTLIMVGISLFRQHDNSNKTSHDIALTGIEADTLNLFSEKEPKNDDMAYSFGDVSVINDILCSENINLDIETSEDTQFHLTQTNSASSRTQADAYRAADEINYPVKVENGVLRLPYSFSLPKGAKWNNQKVTLTLKVPVGKFVRVQNSSYRIIRDVEMLDPDNGNFYDHFQDGSDYPWRMTQKGLTCDNCPKTWFFDKNEHKNDGEEFGNSGENTDENSNSDEDFELNGNFKIDKKDGKIRIKSDSTEINIDITDDGVNMKTKRKGKEL